MIDVDAIPFVQARWYTEAYGRSIDYVVLHTMEFWERSDSAEWCQNFFATSDRKGSTHCMVDCDSICRSVLDKDVCWGANGVNRSGLHIEHAGFAAQEVVDWHDEYSKQMLRLSAELAASWCQKYSVPAVFVDAAGLLAKSRGITTHAEAEIAFPYGGHSDPGAEFPMDEYLALVRGFLGQTPVPIPPTPHFGEDMASLTIHHPEVRSSVVGGDITLDFTYLPLDGSTVKDELCLSYVVLRSVGYGYDQTVQVYFDGSPTGVVVPADGRTVAVPVRAAGLVSVVGKGLVAQGREMWA